MPLPPLVAPVEALSDTERSRAARHVRLAGLGDVGQRRIAASVVAVVGAGGLGSPVVLALAAAGVGALVVIDDDVVELTNLQRQIMHRRIDLGSPKADSAVRVAAELSETRVTAVHERLTPDNAARILSGADVVIDGTDTFESREVVAAACETLGVPLVWGTVQEFAGQATVFWNRPTGTAEPIVLADLYPRGSEAPTCAAVGVFAPLCLQVGALLAAEALKLITGIGEPLLGRIVLIDALKGSQREVPLRPARVNDGTDAAPAARAAVAAGAAAAEDARAEARLGGGAGAGAGLGAATGTGAASSAGAKGGSDIDSSIAAGAAAGAGARPREVADPGDVPVLDVREADELRASGAFPGTRHLPLADLLADPGAVSGPVVVVCQGGMRARRAAAALTAAGVEASVLAGGIDGWRARHPEALHRSEPSSEHGAVHTGEHSGVRSTVR